MTDSKPLLVVLAGPTAVGKTQLAIDIAKIYNTSIVSADSRQIYKQLNIGVAKPTKDQLEIIPHYLINHIDISEDYSAGDFENDAMAILEQLWENNKMVILTGGTGLYIRSVLEGLDDFPITDTSKWEEIHKREGIETLKKALLEKDSEYYNAVDKENPRRLIRALSVIEASGRTYSSFLSQRKKIRPFRSLKIALERPRAELYNRINDRVDEMIDEGLITEAKQLIKNRNLKSLQTVGYQELFDYFDGTINLMDAINKIKQHSRNYAKRQTTWFKNQGNWTNFHPDQSDDIVSFISENL